MLGALIKEDKNGYSKANKIFHVEYNHQLHYFNFGSYWMHIVSRLQLQYAF